MKYIGIDPGKKGAICVMESDVINFFDMPIETTDGKKNIDWLQFMEIMHNLTEDSDVLVCIEKQQQNPSSILQQGQIRMLCIMWDIPFIEVHPSTWKASFGLFRKGKQGSVEYCENILGRKDVRTKRGRGMDERADALLLAVWAQENYWRNE